MLVYMIYDTKLQLYLKYIYIWFSELLICLYWNKKDPVLFSGTLKFNIDPFDQYKETQLWNALEQVNLKTVAENIDKKLEFQCSEGGDNLR